MKTIDLVVPCYNEEEGLAHFVEETNKVIASLPAYRFRYILVNDGSRDKTYLIMKQLAARFDNIKYISFSRNFGKEAAMYAGLQHADADYVVVMDADLQHPPAVFPRMLEAMEEGYDCCATKRDAREGESFFRGLFSKLFFRLSNKLTDVKNPYGAMDFRMMTRQMVSAILELSEVQRFSKGIFSWVGFNTKWFPHENAVRAAGETKWNFKKLFVYACDGILAFSDLPLKLPLYLGGGLCAGAGLYALIALIVFLCGKAVSPVHAVLIVMLFLCGLILFAVGVLGLYLARIYTETKGRPVYIVKETNLKK